MKKYLVLVISVSAVISLTACGGSQGKEETGLLETGEQEAGVSLEVGESEETASIKTGEAEEASARESGLVGDIILLDGSVIKAAEFTVMDSGNVPVAVIAGCKEDGTVLGIGLQRSDEPLQWESDQGEDEEAYPARQFADTYGAVHQLTGAYESGWYMPDIEELGMIYENREAINGSLEIIHELDSQAAMDSLNTNWYWSSSQSESQEDYAWFIHFFNGYAGECPKNFTNVHALAVRTL